MTTNIAFEELLETFNPLISRMAAGLVIPSMDYADLKQEMVIQLWKASIHYVENPETSFFTYAYTALKRKRAELVRDANAAKRVEARFMTSIEEPLMQNQNNTPVFADNIPTNDGNPQEYAEAHEVVDIVSKTLASICTTPISRDICNGMLSGQYTQRELCKKLGCTQSFVSYTWTRFKRALQQQIIERNK